MTVPIAKDMGRTEDAGASQPNEGDNVVSGYAQGKVVSKESTAIRVKATLHRREEFLLKRGLQLNYNMCDDEGGVMKTFLQELKDEYANEPMQRQLQAEDWAAGKNKHDVMRKRWCRELQRRCGTKLFWEIVSLVGVWEPVRLDKSLSSKGDAEKMKTKQQKALTMKALETREAYRCGRHLYRAWQKRGWDHMSDDQKWVLAR